MSAAGTYNDNANSNNIIFTIKNAKLYAPIVTLSARDNRKLSKLLSKGSDRSVYWNKYKKKRAKKNTTNEYRYFLESNFVGVNRFFVLDHSNRDANAKRFNAREYYLQEGVIKNYYFIINRKNLPSHNQAIDSNIKWCEEIRKLTTGQGGDYATGYLLDYDYIKNHYRLVAVDLSEQKNRFWSLSNSEDRILWAIIKTRCWW